MKSAELKQQKKEVLIDQMTAEQVLNELKDKRLPTYGTIAERKDRLKKQYGIQIAKTRAGDKPGASTYSASVVEPSAGMSQTNGFMRRQTTTDKID
jgi:kinesin family protein 2/24